MLRLALAALLALCAPGLALAGGSAPTIAGIDWSLSRLDGAEFGARTTLRLDGAGRLAGQGPCNRYFGTVRGTLPEFRAGAIGSTRMACTDMAAEAQVFIALQAVERAEIIEGRLHLTGGGHEMVFSRLPD